MKWLLVVFAISNPYGNPQTDWTYEKFETVEECVYSGSALKETIWDDKNNSIIVDYTCIPIK